MEIVCSLYDTKMIPKWQSDIRSIEEKECLFLPESFELVEEGRCGSSGVIKVHEEEYRLPSSISHSLCRNRSLTG